MNNTTNTMETKKEIERILDWVRFQRNGGKIMSSIENGYYDYSKKEWVEL